jgi:hypothetical protein
MYLLLDIIILREIREVAQHDARFSIEFGFYNGSESHPYFEIYNLLAVVLKDARCCALLCHHAFLHMEGARWQETV